MVIMTTVLPPVYSLSAECPVKWTIAQERALNDEVVCYDEEHSITGAAIYARQVYLRFLWFPESIVPLRALVASLLRIQSPTTSPCSSSGVPSHPLHDLLRPLLLTPRSTSQKYHSRINRLIEDDRHSEDNEEQMLWLAYRNAKGDAELEQQTQDASGAVSMFDAEEAWKDRWLARMEQREVQVQIILHFLLLSLPGAPTPPIEELRAELPVHLSPSKKRRRKHREPTPPPQGPSLEECLELFMDKLSMWQLMSALDAQDAQRDRGTIARAKGKQRVEDERDWMQIFCEDVVEP
ncbi:uncharacterized protein B0H18DRAFT_1179302, partial [Fomitopsis serialis]|uniref:uncharacterized protein n=1 Tax=Fomitopsis serialis TaxID=139415 RepID=UPI0020083EC3